MNLYKHCLLAIIKHEQTPVEKLPSLILSDIERVQNIQRKWDKRMSSFDQYFKSLVEVGNIALETLTCLNCVHIHNHAFPYPSEQCCYHREMIKYKLQKQRELKQLADMAANIYLEEKYYIETKFEDLKDIVDIVENGIIFEVEQWESL